MTPRKLRISSSTYDGYYSLQVHHVIARFAFYILVGGAATVGALVLDNKVFDWASWINFIPAVMTAAALFADFRQNLAME